MVKEKPEPFLSDKSHTYMLMPVQTATQIPFCIIQMDNLEISDPYLFIELVQGLPDSCFGTELIACSKCMTRVKTDTNTFLIFKPVHDAPDMFKAASHTVLLAGSIF